jgi:hypothetical protein
LSCAFTKIVDFCSEAQAFGEKPKVFEQACACTKGASAGARVDVFLQRKKTAARFFSCLWCEGRSVDIFDFIQFPKEIKENM